MYTFCKECNQYLTPGDQVGNIDEVVWCSFMWSILSNRSIHQHYGDYVWRFVPYEWRPWWLNALQNKFPTIYSNITIDHPSPAIKDKTADIQTWNDDINSYFLARLRFSSNKFLRPVIKCPWGCTEFHHKVGHLPLDIILQRYIQKCFLKTYTSTQLKLEKNVVSAQEDYFRVSYCNSKSFIIVHNFFDMINV